MKYLKIVLIILLVQAGTSFPQENLSSLLNSDFTFFKTSGPNLPVQNQKDELGIQKSMNESRSKGKAFFMSLVLPGLGQRYTGAHIKSQVFLGLEIGLWLSYAGFVTYSQWREQDYRTFAASHAGVSLEGKSSNYFINVGNFDNIYDYNAYRLQQRNLADYYKDIDAYYWDWESEGYKEKFDQLRISSDTAKNRSTYVIGAILANHVLSAIDAVWSVHNYEKARQSKLNWDIQFGDGYINPFVNFSFSAHF